MEMWALVANKQPLEHLEAEDPIPAGSEVIVEVTHCGLCHSDLHLWEGEYNFGRGKIVKLSDRGVTFPHAPGHEIVGNVIALGPDASGVSVGDQRIVYPWVGCGNYPRCAAGDDNLCTAQKPIGVAQHGGFASRVKGPHPRYLVDPQGVDPALASTFACSGITVLSAIRKLEIDDPDSPVLLVGAGGLGHSAIAMLQAMGHRSIIVVDIDETKKSTTLTAGATSFIDGKRDDVTAAVSQAAGGSVFYAMDFVNNSKTAEMAFNCLGKGGTLVLVGIAGGEIELDLAPLVFGAKSLIGSQTGNVQDLKDVVELARSGKLKPIPINCMHIDKANDALQSLLNGQVTGRLVLER